MVSLSGEDHDAAHRASGAITAMLILGKHLYGQAEIAIQSYSETYTEDENDIEGYVQSQVSLTLALAYKQLIDHLRIQLRETAIPLQAERTARAADSCLEDMSAAIDARTKGDDAARISAWASYDESVALVVAALQAMLDTPHDGNDEDHYLP